MQFNRCRNRLNAVRLVVAGRNKQANVRKISEHFFDIF